MKAEIYVRFYALKNVEWLYFALRAVLQERTPHPGWQTHTQCKNYVIQKIYISSIFRQQIVFFFSFFGGGGGWGLIFDIILCTSKQYQLVCTEWQEQACDHSLL